MRRKKAAAGFLILSLCAGASLHRIQAGSFGGFEIDVEEGADSQQWNEEDMGSAPEGENTEGAEASPDQNAPVPSVVESDGNSGESESAGGRTENAGGGGAENARGGGMESTGDGNAGNAGGGETESAGDRNAGNAGDEGMESTGDGNAGNDEGRGTENTRDGNDGKNSVSTKASAETDRKKNPDKESPENAVSVTGRADRNSSQLAAAGPVIASTGISLLSAPLKYYNNINNNKKKNTKYKGKYTEKEIFQEITEKTENGMVNITLFQGVDITVVSLRLNGQEVSWHWEEGKIFLDSPVSKKDSAVEMAVLVNGSQILFSPVWKIL